MEWHEFENGKKMLVYQDEPAKFHVALPPNFFVVECGGCDQAGRMLVDHLGNETFRRNWGFSDAEYAEGLSRFYEQVKATVRIPFDAIDQQDDVFYGLLESTKLKSCPFCGSDDIKNAVSLKAVNTTTPFHMYYLWCCSCRVSNAHEDPKVLIEWWNTRPEFDDAEVETKTEA